MRTSPLAQLLLASAVSLATACTVDGSVGDEEGDVGDGAGGGSGSGDGSGGGSGGGGSSDTGGVEPGDDDTPDGPMTEEADECPKNALGSILELKDIEGTIEVIDPGDPESPAYRSLSGRFGEVDSVEIQLWDGYGAFYEAQAAPGSYPIDGMDADPANCGICVYLYLAKGDLTYTYLATSGLLELETVDDDTMTGSLVSLQFEELASFSALKTDGCETTVDDLPFDGELVAP